MIHLIKDIVFEECDLCDNNGNTCLVMLVRYCSLKEICKVLNINSKLHDSFMKQAGKQTKDGYCALM